MGSPPEHSIVGDLSQYDMRPLGIAGEKTVKGGLAELTAFLVSRAKERKFALSATEKLPGVKTPWLRDLLMGVQKDVYASKIFALIDALECEIVIRPKTMPVTRQSRPSKLKSVKLVKKAREATSADAGSEDVPAEQPEQVEQTEGQRVDQMLKTGVITAEMRRDIDKMLAA